MSLLHRAHVILALLIAFVSAANALPLTHPTALAQRAEQIAHFYSRRDVTTGWSDLSGDAKAGVILAPVLAVVFVICGTFFVLQQKAGNKKMTWKSIFGRSKKRHSVAPSKPETSTHHNIPTITTAPPAAAA